VHVSLWISRLEVLAAEPRSAARQAAPTEGTADRF
jgi:hypothetical protein